MCRRLLMLNHALYCKICTIVWGTFVARWQNGVQASLLGTSEWWGTSKDHRTRSYRRSPAVEQSRKYQLPEHLARRVMTSLAEWPAAEQSTLPAPRVHTGFCT